MATVTLTRALVLETVECCSCGVEFGLPSDFNQNRLRDKRAWWCPNGHQQNYTGKALDQLLREARDEATAAQQLAQRRTQELDGALDKLAKVRKEQASLTKRVENGVCPHCQRTFRALARHMRSKHKGDAEAAQVAKEMKAQADGVAPNG